MKSSSRDAFLQRVREALRQGNRPGEAADIPARGGLGYQGAGTDPVARFAEQLTAAGGHPYIVPDRAAALAQVIELVRSRSARRALVGRGDFIDTLGLLEQLQAIGVEAVSSETFTVSGCRDAFFNADIGITGVGYLVAETGTLALLARSDEPRSFSLLPPVHIAVAQRAQVLPDLFDLFSLFSVEKPVVPGQSGLPSCLALITGPSKTGDIELRLVTGVHGPGEIHVVLVNAPG